ncbi:MAG: HlyC/CorC family transporter [Desulfobulbaceae bacterium]|nr:HlyC/CorC family transporter [Desulfobulbaceae bacterium]
MNDDNTSEDSDPEQDSTVSEKSFFKKILSLVDFRKPGTKEDLDLEIQELLEEGEEHGLISPLEERMINSILEFRETYASEIMTPAAEVVSFDEASPMSELIEIVIESGFTRIPVYRENPDKVIGAIHAKDLLELCARPQAGDVNFEEYLRPVYFIPESKPIVDLLREFQKRKVHMAMVTDEFGTMRGLITLEDILEEIVGEIDDEYDEEEHVVEIIDKDTVQVHGWVDIEKIEEHFDVEFPDGPYESVGGLVIHLLGRLAEINDEVEIAGFRLKVDSASARQIKKIYVTRLVEQELEE